MSDLDKKRIDRLYELKDCEKLDPDTAAALYWAIFQLEQRDREKQTGDLVFRLAFAPESEVNSIMDTGAFNEIIKGYLVIAMQATGVERNSIQEAVDALDDAFDDTDAEAAHRAYREF